MKEKTALRGTMKESVLLSNYTSWKVGGHAKRIYQPADCEDLSHFLKQLPEQEPWLWLGLGSNTLLKDSGFQGTAILTQGRLNEIHVLCENKIFVEAGVACPRLARFCARNGLAGIEFLAGIPGTLGGALAMNAGCHGKAIWEYVDSVKTINRAGQINQRNKKDYEISYRHVNFPADEGFISAELKLRSGDQVNSFELIREVLAHRMATQPSQPSAGSVFRNPLNHYAGFLIEQCGLKGYQIGQAQISEKHANFIINLGQATSQDIQALIKYARKQVQTSFDLDLVSEVHIQGVHF